MSLNQKLIAACPLLLPRDRLQLHTAVHLSQDYFIDRELGAKHNCTTNGHQILTMLQNGITHSALHQRAKRLAISDAQLLEFLGFLNKNGLLVRRANSMQNLLRRIVSIRNFVLGVRHEKLSYRTIFSPWALLRICGRTTAPLVWLAVIYSCILPQIGADTSIVALLWTSIGLITFSLYLHEFCHILIVRQTTKQMVIVRSGSRLGILHKKLSPRREFVSALSGPLGALAACLLLGFMVWLAGFQFLAVSSLLIGSLHIFSFLPAYSDGAILLTNLRKRTP